MELTPQETQRVFVHKDGRACIVCPDCGTTKSVDLSRRNHLGDRFRVRCYCHSVFPVCCDHRRAERKETYLDGCCTKVAEENGWSKIVVRDISSLGMGFTTSASHNMEQGEEILVSVTPVGPQQHDIRREATVRHSVDGNLGVEFNSPLEFEEASSLGLLV